MIAQRGREHGHTGDAAPPRTTSGVVGPAVLDAILTCLDVHPTPEFSPEVSPEIIAAVAGTPLDTATAALRQLAEDDALALTLTPTLHCRLTDIGHYRAWELRQSRSAEERDHILREIAQAYLAAAAAADRAVLGCHRRRQGSIDDARQAPAFTAATAMQWLITNRENLSAIARTMSGQRWWNLLWQLGESLPALYGNLPHQPDWTAVSELSVYAAQQVGHTTAEVRQRCDLARAHIQERRWHDASLQLHTALCYALDSNDTDGQAAVLETQGLLNSALCRTEPDPSVAHSYLALAHAQFQDAFDLHQALHQQHGAATVLYQRSKLYRSVGEPAVAATLLRSALETATRLRDEHLATRVRIELGRAWLALDDVATARHLLTTAVTVATRRHQPRLELRALSTLVPLMATSAASSEHYQKCQQRLAELQGRWPQFRSVAS